MRMKEVTLITGPLRSGTSCVTGLLECCGFDLGKNIRVLRTPTSSNPKGHFELDLLYTINDRLLVESAHGPWSILKIPDEPILAELAAKREHYFRLFLSKFDGELCKDPVMCLMLPFWEPYWSELQRIVFCLRHPLAAAHSMKDRYWLPTAQGLRVWQIYTARFFHHRTRCQVYIFDYDAFRQAPCDVFTALLRWLRRSLPTQELQKHLESFFQVNHVHWSFGERELQTLPDDVRELYLEIRSRAGAIC